MDASARGGIAGCRSRCGPSTDHHRWRQRAEPPQRGQRFIHSLWRQQPGALYLAAQRTQNLFVEDRSQIARQTLIYDETNGVRADINDRDGFLCRAHRTRCHLAQLIADVLHGA